MDAQTIIALSALIVIISFAVKLMIDPVKDQQTEMKNDIKSLQIGQNELKQDIISAVDAKMDEQWKALNERTMEDFKNLLNKCLKEKKI